MDTKMIGSKISEARKKVNMSQAKLAGLLFISPQAVGKWERGESSPDMVTFNRLAEILGVDLNYFSENYPSVNNETIFKIPADSHANTGQAPEEATDQAGPELRPLQVTLTAVNLEGSDFSGVVLHKGKFKASPLRGADFTGADLSGSLFEVCDAREVNFDGANLTDCSFSITELGNASFRKTTLVRTDFNKSSLAGTRFAEATLTGVKLTMTDLRKTIFEHCVFNGADFRYSDLRGMHFEGQTFIGVRFEKSALDDISFTGATLRNVSFRLPSSVTNKSYRAFKTVCFDGAMMDKLTYAGLKALWVADLSGVILI